MTGDQLLVTSTGNLVNQMRPRWVFILTHVHDIFIWTALVLVRCLILKRQNENAQSLIIRVRLAPISWTLRQQDQTVHHGKRRDVKNLNEPFVKRKRIRLVLKVGNLFQIKKAFKTVENVLSSISVELPTFHGKSYLQNSNYPFDLKSVQYHT